MSMSSIAPSASPRIAPPSAASSRRRAPATRVDASARVVGGGVPARRRHPHRNGTSSSISSLPSRVDRRGDRATARALDALDSVGSLVGIGAGVVALAFAAGAANGGGAAGGADADADADADAARGGRTGSGRTGAQVSGKQTIAGGVAGANNPKKKKQMPGMPVKPNKKASGGGKKKKKGDGDGLGVGGMMNVLDSIKKGAPAVPGLSKMNAQRYAWGAAEATGPREYMEDAWVVKETGLGGGYFFASVMDGHGGAASSAYLRENLFSLLDEKIPKFGAGEGTPGAVPDGTPDGGYLAKSLKTGFDAADESLIDHIARLGEPECWSGSTCTSVLVRDDRVVAANVGDSRAVLIRKGKALELTADHRPLGSSVTGRQEMDRITRAGGWSVGGRVCGILAVSRAFGDYEFKGGRFDLLNDLSEEPLAKKATLAEPPVVPTPAVKEIARDAETDEWLVIASDGLWDTVNSTACATFISQECKKNPGMRADALADALVKRAIRFRTQDNVCVVVVDLRRKEAATAA